MKSPKKNRKLSISISLDVNIIKQIDDNFTNKSKFLEYSIIEELCKDLKFKDELKNKHIIL